MADTIQQVPEKLIILQPTPFCNIACEYCYLPSRNSTKRMSREVAKRVFEQVFASEYFDAVTFVWHAGEPLVLPTDYYKEMFDIANTVNQKFGKTFRHNIQTNGTLIDDDWVKLIEKYDIQIGISVDGPKFIHDKYRVNRSGKGTHDKVMAGIRKLQNAQLDFGVIMVLTAYALDFPDEIFDFFVSNDLRDLAFNVEEIEGTHSSSSLQMHDSIDKYKKFMKRVLTLTDQASVPLYIREWNTTITALLAPLGDDQNLIESTNRPLHILTVSHAGDFSTFCPELAGTSSQKYSNFIMGNILKDPIESIFDNPVFQSVNNEIQAGIQLCKSTCQYWDFCGGGNPGNKFFEHGRFDVSETMACRLQKQALIDVTIEYLEDRIGKASIGD